MKVNLTHRDLILIRVALIRNLDAIKTTAPASYEEVHTLLNGKLWEAELAAKKEESLPFPIPIDVRSERNDTTR